MKNSMLVLGAASVSLLAAAPVVSVGSSSDVQTLAGKLDVSKLLVPRESSLYN